MSFPQLLRRSAFAQHDPLITRIYTSTPSAVSQTGDWGLKYPIHRPKGPKYIKVSNLDAGAAVGADWRSGEKEARFLEAWGTGKVQWQRMGQPIVKAKAPSNYDSLTADQTPTPEQPDLIVPDIESMTPSEFESYLDTVREKRKAFLPIRLKEIDPTAWQEDEGDNTLVQIATSGNAAQADGTRLQSGLVKTELDLPKSKTIQSNPHPQGGLYYSQPLHSSPISTSYIDPRTTIPGRAINKKDRTDHRQDSARTRFTAPDNALPYIISVGGLTGSASSRVKVADEQDFAETDYTRTSPQRGVGRFQIQSARFINLPTVLNLKSTEIASRYGQYPRSLAKRATPLDTFNFTIDLELANETPRGEGRRLLEPGSREWVARERARKIAPTSDLGLGGPKASRVTGAARANLRTAEKEGREIQRSSIASLQDRLARKPAELRQR